MLLTRAKHEEEGGRMRKFLSGCALTLAASLVFSSSLHTTNAAATAVAPVVTHSLKNDVSPALRDIPPGPPQVGPLYEIFLGRRPLSPSPEAIEPDLVVQDTPAPLALTGPILTFEGVNNVNGVLPPDTNGDVGPNHYVQWVNLSFAIYDKSGVLLYGPANGNTLWTGFGGPCETTNDGDPIALYDHLADRWLLSQFALPNFPSGPFYQCIAVSQTSDPTGAYYRYAFEISATKLNDYPKFGVWPDAYYMSINQFLAPIFPYAGAGAVAFERDKLLNGQAAQMVYFDLFTVNSAFGGMLPSDLDGPPPPAGAPNYFAEVDDSAVSPFLTDSLRIWEFQVDWVTPTNSIFGVAGNPNTVLNTAPFNSNMCGFSRNCIPQKNTFARVDALSDRLLHRLQYRNFGSHQTLVANHTVDVGADHAGVRWYELRNSGAGWTIHQQGTHAPDNNHRWMGSAAMDGDGNIAVGFSVSSTSMFPAIRYAGRLAGDPLGMLTQGEATLIGGTGSQTHFSGRWGDYSALSVDPTDDCTFWYTNEYYTVTSSANWRTRVGSFRLPTCGGGPTVSPLTVQKLTLTLPSPGALTLKSTAVLTSGANIDPASEPVSVVVKDADGDIVNAVIPVNNFTVNAAGDRWTFNDKSGAIAGGITKMIFKSQDGQTFTITAKGKNLDTAAANRPTLDVEITVGDDVLSAAGVPCSASASKNVCKQ
jgi:hypothetical protein